MSDYGSMEDVIEDERGNLIDPLKFSIALFCILVLFVFYLLLPRGIRKQYFGSYPKRHAWSARSRRSRHNGQVRLFYLLNNISLTRFPHITTTCNKQSNNKQGSVETSSYAGGSSMMGTTNTTFTNPTLPQPMGLSSSEQQLEHPHHSNNNNDEIVLSAAMQQLRDPGVLIVAHGSRGKPKTVRLQLTEHSITWRTETRKSTKKLGKLHQVPLSHIMYVDVGKQTTALRRVENAAVSESLCFSLLTKEGSLDLEANSPRERDALVSCFSLVLDEVHAQNWRDIYRGPSSDMPSSFDELDNKQHQNA